ncbi:pyruvate kinase [Patescibacteria group bacterium]|nr:pyruvate kinase [Patescibacteria group bacterium]
MKFDFKRTKIICTIGPASWDYETIKKLVLSGMDIARINMSHGTHEEKAEQIDHIRRIAFELGKPITIFADLQGPKMRLGEFVGTREILTGQKVKFSVNPQADELPIQFDLAPFLQPQQRLFLNDGLVALTVDSVVGQTITATALNDGWVSSKKGINVPDTQLGGKIYTQKDLEDAKFALEHEVDFLALSFIQQAADIEYMRQFVKEHDSKAKLITKVETALALKNLAEVVKTSDAVMVARGDLAIETKPEDIPIIQQEMIRLCRQNQIPVIVATQMLESMVENPRPTRAEVSDVGRAVLDEADAVMLSAESASGKYPVESVETMHGIIMSVEKNPEYKNYIKINWQNIEEENFEFSAVAASAAALAFRINAKTIVVTTSSGRTARLLSSFRPSAKIIAVTHDQLTQNQLVLNWGILPEVIEPLDDEEMFESQIVAKVREIEDNLEGEKVVVVSGSIVGESGRVNNIKVVTL